MTLKSVTIWHISCLPNTFLGFLGDNVDIFQQEMVFFLSSGIHSFFYSLITTIELGSFFLWVFTSKEHFFYTTTCEKFLYL